MAQPTFHHATPDRLSSPERLDQLLRVTTLNGWIVLGALGALLVAALVWGVAGSIATTVTGQGILLHGGRVYGVIAPVSGEVSALFVKVGDSVAEGQLVAIVAPPNSLNSADVTRVTSAYSGRVIELRAERGSIVKPSDALLIIASNSGGDCLLGNSVLSGSRNLIGDNSCAFAAGTVNQTNTNPLLGALALNGGATRTHQPVSGSLAVDRGGSTDCPSLDQRGTRRPQGGSCDVGAFETPSNVRLGVAAFALPQGAVTAEQTATLTLSWTVPAPMTWTDLRTVDFQLDAGEEQPLVVRFSQGVTATNELGEAGEPGLGQQATTLDTLSLFDASGEVGTGDIGANAVLESAAAALDLAQSRLASDGPGGKTMTLTIALRLKRPLAGKVYSASLVATDDAGDIQGPDTVGALAVGPFQAFVPLVRQP